MSGRDRNRIRSITRYPIDASVACDMAHDDLQFVHAIRMVMGEEADTAGLLAIEKNAMNVLRRVASVRKPK